MSHLSIANLTCEALASELADMVVRHAEPWSDARTYRELYQLALEEIRSLTAKFQRSENGLMRALGQPERFPPTPTIVPWYRSAEEILLDEPDPMVDASEIRWK